MEKELNKENGVPTLIITKELFVQTINAIKSQIDHDTKCHEAFSVILSDDYVTGYNNTFLQNQLLSLLTEGMGDFSDMIGYYIWELDFGTKYTDGCVTDKDKNNIDVSTPEKLYDYLVTELKNE